ncbi:MAG: hypothetical protein C4309_09830 [Chloroflexota bacterium]
MPTILFVCTGNICRSPMAVGLLRARLARDGRERAFGGHLDGGGATRLPVLHPGHGGERH